MILGEVVGFSVAVVTVVEVSIQYSSPFCLCECCWQVSFSCLSYLVATYIILSFLFFVCFFVELSLFFWRFVSVFFVLSHYSGFVILVVFFLRGSYFIFVPLVGRFLQFVYSCFVFILVVCAPLFNYFWIVLSPFCFVLSWHDITPCWLFLIGLCRRGDQDVAGSW